MSTTPTTRATWRNSNLVHHALVQPYSRDDVSRCDLLVACCGFERCVISTNLGPYDDMITCITCLGTNWDATLEEMDRQGLLTKADGLSEDTVLHRILMEGNAFAPTALRSNRR